MLSKLELLLYREFLRIPTGMIASYQNPMERLFNIVFIPAVTWIIFLIYATKPFPKGIRYLLMIAFTAFGVVNGFYPAWVTFSQAWFIFALLIPVAYFVIETFVDRTAMYNIAAHYEALGKTSKKKFNDKLKRKYEIELERVKNEIEMTKESIARLESHPRRFGSAGSQIEALLKSEKDKLDKLMKKKAELERKIGRYS